MTSGTAERPRVVVEHPDFLVVAKPAGWLTHRGRPAQRSPILLDYLQQERGEPELAPPHRLDRETSGAQLLSRDSDAARQFFELFRARRVTKTYLTLVHGWPDWDATTLDAPLGHVGLSEYNGVLIRQGVTPDGRAAVTEFRVRGRRSHPLHGPLTLIEALPRSGRLHQIRAHLSHLRLPMVGDKIYGRVPGAFEAMDAGQLDEGQRAQLILARQALHAWRVAFVWDGAAFEAEVPLAADMAGLWGTAQGRL